MFLIPNFPMALLLLPPQVSIWIISTLPSNQNVAFGDVNTHLQYSMTIRYDSAQTDEE